MDVHFLTLFPDEVRAFFLKGLMARAIDRGHTSATVIALRDYAIDRYGHVDSPPYGGSAGMLLRVDVLHKAIEACQPSADTRFIYPCPKGRRFTQTVANQYVTEKRPLFFLPGYYEGIDERLMTLYNIERVCVTDAVLSSSDVAALVIAEAVLRLVPGVIGKSASVDNDSIISGLLEHPHYTQPADYAGCAVPAVLRSGHHQKIQQWRHQQSLKQTLQWRADLLVKRTCTNNDMTIITALLDDLSQ